MKKNLIAPRRDGNKEIAEINRANIVREIDYYQ